MLPRLLLRILLCAVISNMAVSLSPVSKANHEFAINLYKDLCSGRDTSKDLFFSPFSISVAMAMTYAGTDGNTRRELAKGMCFDRIDNIHEEFSKVNAALAEHHPSYALNIANKLFAQAGYKILDKFLSTMKDSYKAELGIVNYKKEAEKARKEINTYVEEKTKHKIRELIGSGVLNALTRLVIVNAVYFKGKWATQFDPKNTRKLPFFLSESEKIEVAMMSKKSTFKIGVSKNLGAQVLELPYVGKEMSMFILLPNKVDGLATMEKMLTSNNIEEAMASVRSKNHVFVYLPKFKLEDQFGLVDVLKKSGIKDLFDENKCDLSNITGNVDLHVSAVIHKSFVDVNEEGTEAAAATAVVMMARSMPMTIEFVVNHPFLFIINDNKTNTILFMGRLIRPSPY